MARYSESSHCIALSLFWRSLLSAQRGANTSPSSALVSAMVRCRTASIVWTASSASPLLLLSIRASAARTGLVVRRPSARPRLLLPPHLPVVAALPASLCSSNLAFASLLVGRLSDQLPLGGPGLRSVQLPCGSEFFECSFALSLAWSPSAQHVFVALTDRNSASPLSACVPFRVGYCCRLICPSFFGVEFFSHAAPAYVCHHRLDLLAPAGGVDCGRSPVGRRQLLPLPLLRLRSSCSRDGPRHREDADYCEHRVPAVLSCHRFAPLSTLAPSSSSSRPCCRQSFRPSARQPPGTGRPVDAS